MTVGRAAMRLWGSRARSAGILAGLVVLSPMAAAVGQARRTVRCKELRHSGKPCTEDERRVPH